MFEKDINLVFLLILIIWSSPFLSRLIHLPTSVIEILIGSILGTLNMINGANQYFIFVAEIGFLYLMFLAGLEVNLSSLLNSPKNLLKRSGLYIFIILMMSAFFGYMLNLNVIYTLSLPLVSIGLLATISKNYGKDLKWIKMAFTVGVMGEIISIILLTVLDAASGIGFGVELLKKLMILFIFIFLIVISYKALDILFWWIPELKEELMPTDDKSEQDIRLTIFLFTLLIFVAVKLHLELALGAFLAGVAISTFFHYKKLLEEKMSSFGFGFLIPIFFIHIGTTFDLTSFKYEQVVIDMLLIVALSIGVKIFGGFILRKYLAPREIIMMGLSLSMPLTLLVAVATIGKNTNYVSFLEYYSLIGAAILEVIISMVTIKILSKKG